LFDPAHPASQQVSSAQLASTTIACDTVLPAGIPLRLVAIGVEKTLLVRWLGSEQAAPLGLLTARQPRLVEALLTPEVQAALQEITAPRPPHELDLLFYRLKVQELLYWLLRELAQRAGGHTRPLHSADAARLLQVRTALLAALDRPPSLAQLAHTAGMSETKLKQLFRQVFGSSPYAYYQAARLREAKRLLPQWSVAEVGYQLGFTNLGHFAQLFKRQYGLTPKRYQATQHLGKAG
jgi:AraC-like DNA-binding protein